MLLGGGGGGPITLGNKASYQSSINETAFSVSSPAGVVNGNLLFAVISNSGSGSNAYVSTGWTQRYNRGSFGGLSVFTKVAGSEPSSWSWTATVNRLHDIVVFAVSNAIYDTIGTASTDVDPLVAPAITVGTNNSLLFGAYSAGSAGSTATTPTGMTVLFADNNSTAPSMYVFSQSVSSGATGTRSSTIGSSVEVTGILFSANQG